MGILKDIYQHFKEKREQALREREDTPDDVTTDKYLRSLRRQRRIQLEEFEKAKLLKDIRQHEIDRANKYLWGIKKQKAIKQKKALEAKYNLLNKTRKNNIFKL